MTNWLIQREIKIYNLVETCFLYDFNIMVPVLAFGMIPILSEHMLSSVPTFSFILMLVLLLDVVSG